MKKLFTSGLLTLTAVPFLMAAPVAKKAQDQPAASSQTQTATKTVKKTQKSHVKKSKKATGTDAAAPANPSK